MKKLFATMTAMTFVLGLTAAGWAQSTVKTEVKPTVATQTETASPVTPGANAQGETKSITPPVTKESKVKSKKHKNLGSQKQHGKKSEAATQEPQQEENQTTTK